MFGRLFGRSYTSTSAQGKQSSPETSSAIPVDVSDLHGDQKHSPSYISASPELLHHLRDIVLPAPLPQDAFDPARHMRIVVAQDPFSHSARSPLFDSHLSRDPRTLRRNAFGSYSSMDSTEAGSYVSTTSGGSASSNATQDISLFPGPPPESPSFYRLVDYMFGSVPMSYKGASVKMRRLNTTESSDRRSFLVTKLFSVSAREGPKVSYASSATIPDGVPVYPKIYAESASQLSFSRLDSTSSFLPAEHEWEPTPAPGDSLPFARSKGLFFAIGVIISIPRDYPYLLSANWTAFSRALDEFARVVHAELQSAVLSHAQLRQCGSAMDGFSIPLTAQQLRISPLTANERVRASALRFTTRFASGLSAPRVRCGISKWDVWREEARRLDDLFSSSENDCSTYLETVLASFLGADTDWLETFGFVNPLFEGCRHKSIKTPPTRTIVAGDNRIAQRILYLLAAFLPAGASRNPSVLLKSSPAVSPGPSFLASHNVSRGALDIPGGRQSLCMSMPLYDSHSNLHISSSVASYISSIWSRPSSVTTALTPSNLSAQDGSAISPDASISDAVSYSSSSAELDIDTDFFGPWDDVSGLPISVGGGSASMTGSLPGNATMTSSYDTRPRCSVTPGSRSGEAILDVAVPPRYADLRVPSLAISVNKKRSSSGVKFDLAQPTSTCSASSVDDTGIPSFFHPEFKLQACSSTEEDTSLVLRAIIEDAEYGRVPITLNSWTVVSRALVIDVDTKSVMVWNLLRRLSDDGTKLLQQVVKTVPVCRGCDLARMWVDERLSQACTPSYSPNLAARELVEQILSDIVDAAGTQDLRMGISQMMLGPGTQDLAV
ncbi:hypothetical protein V1517DRAFT_104468 [Lipomyces orientalis]|uniref:Uncharacterized protein n=1 Tax=Lipomyces orientalis TaxID=1233043 RepID=A0ACC3TRH2_9ASCO